jgi:hypothetical protein
MAAGLGFKTFTTGEVLTAGDVNGYLMQGVLVFADGTARDAAITSPEEGQFAYLKSDNKLYYYTGVAWAEADTSGILPSEFAAKGDLLAGTGASTFDNLTVGANGTVLTADSTETTGLKWVAAAGGGGKVLQVVQGTTTTRVDIASTSFTDSTLTATITPSLATSKILVLISQQLWSFRATTVSAARVRLLRGATTIWGDTATGATTQILATGATQAELGHYFAINYLDSPNTTSATTYKTQGRAEDTANSGDISFHKFSNTNTIILMEIGA